MQEECTRDRLEFARLGRREVIAGFAGGHVSSDAGGILLREADLQTGCLAACSESLLQAALERGCGRLRGF